MRRILISTLALALLPASVPAQAETASPGAAAASAQSSPRQPAPRAEPDPDREVCVTERLSGSRMPRRVCRTARQWQLLQNDGSDDR
jgi:hypothetical protein